MVHKLLQIIKGLGYMTIKGLGQGVLGLAVRLRFRVRVGVKV